MSFHFLARVSGSTGHAVSATTISMPHCKTKSIGTKLHADNRRAYTLRICNLSNPTIEGGGDFGFPSPVSDGDVIKTALSGDGNTYPPT